MAPGMPIRPYEGPETTFSGIIETVETKLLKVDEKYPVGSNARMETRINRAIIALEVVCSFQEKFQAQQQQSEQEEGQLTVPEMISLAKVRELLVNYCLVSRVLCALQAEKFNAWDNARIQDEIYYNMNRRTRVISRGYKRDATRESARILEMFWGAQESDFQLSEPGGPDNITERHGWDAPIHEKLDRLAVKLRENPSHIRGLF
ncbi:hypothetical protein F5X99DRAFT_414426 [Biscogniauxia marginata]|nr:hypothetical protein F5X99DRAFT_414426 [Biscogniauxia marginata]